MILRNELRIGNIITNISGGNDSAKNSMAVSALNFVMITCNSLTNDQEKKVKYEDAFGVEISHDTLVSMNFRRQGSSYECVAPNGESFYLAFMGNDVGWKLYHDTISFSKQVKYIHQLQNAIHFLSDGFEII